MVSTAKCCDSALNEDDQKNSVLNNKNDSSHICESARQYDGEVDKVEKLQCVDEHSINYLVSSGVSNPASANVEPDDIRLKIVELNKTGLGPVAIARSLGISRQRASRWIRRHEEKNGFVDVQKSTRIPENIIKPFPETARCKDDTENNSQNGFISFNDDDVEELQCIDEDSIEVLKSLYMSDDATSDFLKAVPHEDCVRDQIVSLHKEGLGPTAIARELGITRQRASRWVKRFICEGAIFTKQRIGRPKKLTTDQKCLIRKFIEERPYATITEVMTVFNLDCSRSTVRTVMKASIWDDLA